MKSYYEDEHVTIYHGDSREILPTLPSPGYIVTDPPYPDYHQDTYAQAEIDFLATLECPQLIFWSARAPFPLDYTAVHIWDKRIGAGVQYERIFERNGGQACRVFRNYSVIVIAATFYRDEFPTGHPSQKPINLMRSLMETSCKGEGIICDPFMGSGTTLRAAKDLNRKAIGIEVEERYCELAAKRMAQEVLSIA